MLHVGKLDWNAASYCGHLGLHIALAASDMATRDDIGLRDTSRDDNELVFSEYYCARLFCIYFFLTETIR